MTRLDLDPRLVARAGKARAARADAVPSYLVHALVDIRTRPDPEESA
jgi:hypothetical protein